MWSSYEKVSFAAIPFTKSEMSKNQYNNINTKLSFSRENAENCRHQNKRNSKKKKKRERRKKNCAEFDEMKIAAIQYTHSYNIFAMVKLHNSHFESMVNKTYIDRNSKQYDDMNSYATNVST